VHHKYLAKSSLASLSSVIIHHSQIKDVNKPNIF